MKLLYRFRYYLIAGAIALIVSGHGSVKYVEVEPQRLTPPTYTDTEHGCVVMVPPGVKTIYRGKTCAEIR